MLPRHEILRYCTGRRPTVLPCQTGTGRRELTSRRRKLRPRKTRQACLLADASKARGSSPSSLIAALCVLSSPPTTLEKIEACCSPSDCTLICIVCFHSRGNIAILKEKKKSSLAPCVQCVGALGLHTSKCLCSADAPALCAARCSSAPALTIARVVSVVLVVLCRTRASITPDCRPIGHVLPIATTCKYCVFTACAHLPDAVRCETDWLTDIQRDTDPLTCRAAPVFSCNNLSLRQAGASLVQSRRAFLSAWGASKACGGSGTHLIRRYVIAPPASLPPKQPKPSKQHTGCALAFRFPIFDQDLGKATVEDRSQAHQDDILQEPSLPHY